MKMKLEDKERGQELGAASSRKIGNRNKTEKKNTRTEI
jgi:hypothetical protein